MSLTGVDAIVLKAGAAQLEVRRRVNKHCFVVASVADLLVVFVPAHVQGVCGGGFAFKTMSLAHLHKGSGRKFLDKLRGFCKVKTRSSYCQNNRNKEGESEDNKGIPSEKTIRKCSCGNGEKKMT